MNASYVSITVALLVPYKLPMCLLSFIPPSAEPSKAMALLLTSFARHFGMQFAIGAMRQRIFACLFHRRSTPPSSTYLSLPVSTTFVNNM
eukprot:9371483-Pyramimonas_sp.AAC.1